MPAINFSIRWPDGSEESCYSPSTIVRQHFKPGDTMPLNEFISIAEVAMDAASERVKETYGYFCSSALDQLALIKGKAAQYEGSDNPQIEIISVT